MAAFRKQLRLLLADRHTPEAAALFQTLLKYIHKRVATIASRFGTDSLTNTEIEEVVADVLLQLMSGGIQQFRGESLPELLGFVRTISDRCTWRAVSRRQKERCLITEASWGCDDLTTPFKRPDEEIEVVADSPLCEEDQEYLHDLLRAGTKAELARRAGVSRAAVTQRVQRIRSRISQLPMSERFAHDAWMHQAAHAALQLEHHSEIE